MIFKSLIFVVILHGYFQDSFQLSTPQDATYQAGVVEFAPSTLENPKAKLKDNLKRIKNIIESNEAKNLDILVFPEAILNNVNWMTYVPDPEMRIAPCDTTDYANFLNEISCSARSRNTYVVINIVEKEHCGAIPGYKDKCDPSGMNIYNTNVVFDRQGRVISRYRKTHLYRREWQTFNVRSKPEMSYFTTDFGVTFGHFICFDLLFYEPALRLVRELNITDIIYPTHWFSELPFLTAVQLQEGWAFANDVNLLAADGSSPSTATTGSGIYAGKFGRLDANIYEDPTTSLMKATVPKRDRRSEYQIPPIVVPQFSAQLETRRLSKVALYRDYNVDIFETKLLDADFMAANETLCHGKFCCHFDIRRQFISSSTMHSAYRYRLAAYDGNQVTFQRIDPAELSICVVVACTNDDLYSCGHIFSEGVLVGNKYYFASMRVRGSFRNTARRAILPSTVDGTLMPLPVSMYDWKEEVGASATDVEITLKSPKSDILTFGIWTNHYSTAVSKHNLDLPNYIKNGCTAMISSKLYAMTAFLVLMVKRLV